LGAVYRTQQFINALRARVEPDELRVLDQHLTPQQKTLFLAMETQDQRHCLDVYRYLLDCNQTDVTLLQAALLHDIGKANVGMRVLYRVAIVLLRAFWPGMLVKLSSQRVRDWRYPFWIHKHHGELGAEMLAMAGGSPKLIEMVRLHQEEVDDPLMRALYEADGAN
jgi:putative nucleotidyltransferase with HDIG domain